MAVEVVEVEFKAKAVWSRSDEGFGVDEAKEAEVVSALYGIPAFESVEVEGFKVKKAKEAK